jgi:hypothetical protein
MDLFCAYCADQQCHGAQVDDAKNNKTPTISASVGAGGVNQSDDVVAIQSALNKIAPTDGGPMPLLDPDGKVGPLTIGAIRNFQIKQFGWADGRVDPEKTTNTRLRQLMPRSALDEFANPFTLPLLFANIEEARSWVRQALVVVGRARDRLADFATDLTGDSADRDVALVSKYFHIDRVSRSMALVHVAFVENIFRNMMTCIGHSSAMTSFGTGFFQEAPVFLKPGGAMGLAVTTAGGMDLFKDGRPMTTADFHMSGPPLRLDTIYVFTTNLQKFNMETYAYTIVHEMAHFVGPDFRGADAVKDHSYHTRANFNTLPPHWAVRTADCYSQFAAEAKFGRPAILQKGG